MFWLAPSNSLLSFRNLRDFSTGSLEGASLREANLSHADLTDADLHDTKLVNANLREANLSYADLTDADLRGACLIQANMAETNLTEANLAYANLSKASLIEANLSGTDLRRADLSDAILEDIASMERAWLKGVIGLSQTQLEEFKAKGAVIDKDLDSEFVPISEIVDHYFPQDIVTSVPSNSDQGSQPTTETPDTTTLDSQQIQDKETK
ncbi:pentapeptide repeat-containing protein [Ktedonobacter robiniae]|uniref:Pentapeptide repeat-containing protein n=1 Tax=Ktedonobacter robiniae TaxID=2778365 RepID=A0ABQ3UP11_9CHLR|nr:pentapeptide repeat-containing protein [Ktedonobacter robiniae]GHO54456.1 hypothetical protein KSB_29310 [Ktedonobacter robiniae]